MVAAEAFEFEVPAGVRVVVGIVPHDVDGDGDLDLLYCNYRTTTRTRHYNRRVVRRRDNWLFINQGELRFTESDKRGITDAVQLRRQVLGLRRGR